MLLPCFDCFADISSSAKSCVNCGLINPHPKWKNIPKKTTDLLDKFLEVDQESLKNLFTFLKGNKIFKDDKLIMLAAKKFYHDSLKDFIKHIDKKYLKNKDFIINAVRTEPFSVKETPHINFMRNFFDNARNLRLADISLKKNLTFLLDILKLNPCTYMCIYEYVYEYFYSDKENIKNTIKNYLMQKFDSQYVRFISDSSDYWSNEKAKLNFLINA
jgi:hypothetical protein